jgi:anti-anti-sigma regulatory factor
VIESKILMEEWGPGLWLLVIAGEHDLATATRLEQTLAEIERRGTDLIMDFSEATFIDSSTLREVLKHADKPSERVGCGGRTARHPATAPVQPRHARR